MKRTRIACLLFLHYLHALSPEEEKELREWKECDLHHAGLMQEVTETQEIEKRRQVAALFDEERAWRRLRKQTAGSRSAVRPYRMWMRAGVAAAVLGVCLVWTFRDSSLGESASRSLACSPALLPPQDGVVLFCNEERKVLRETSRALADTLVWAGDGSAADDTLRVEVPRGNTFTMVLDDGTTVYLNSETKLQMPHRLGREQREVRLLCGEAYFEVAHDSLRPFVVQSRRQSVRVLGTSFGIRAYAHEPQTLTTLVSGRVRVKAGEREDNLLPGYQARSSAEGLTVCRVNTALYTSWYKGVYVFRNESLGNILETLARWYDVEVVCADESLKNICFTGELKRYRAVNEFLEKLEMLEKVKFAVEGRTITVSSYY